MKFYLGTHEIHWLFRHSEMPLFISHRRLRKRKKLGQAATSWALDSGGFSELSLFGKWTIPVKDYVDSVFRYNSEIQKLDFCSIQDWMCEPKIIQQTGKSVSEHQKLTIESYLELKDSVKDVLFIPVLQGWLVKDYEKHIELYDKAGIDLRECKLVGLGSVCRRQDTSEVQEMIRHFSYHGLKLHGFGFKKRGLKSISDYLFSADSMAWSYGARHGVKLEKCSHKTCTNCFEFAKVWYEKVLSDINQTKQNWLWGM